MSLCSMCSSKQHLSGIYEQQDVSLAPGCCTLQKVQRTLWASAGHYAKCGGGGVAIIVYCKNVSVLTWYGGRVDK